MKLNKEKLDRWAQQRHGNIRDPGFYTLPLVIVPDPLKFICRNDLLLIIYLHCYFIKDRETDREKDNYMMRTKSSSDMILHYEMKHCFLTQPVLPISSNKKLY